MKITDILTRTAFFVLCAAGVVLSLAAHFGWCATDACTMYDKVRVYGIGVSIWGLAFFVIAAATEALSRFRPARVARTVLVAGAVGAEAVLLYTQWKFDEYCAICLGVAGVVLALGLVVAIRITSTTAAASRGRKKRLQVLSTLPALFVGILLAWPVQALVDPSGEYPRADIHAELEKIPYLGEEGAWPIVRVYSDYLCPWCRKQEPIINEVLGRNLDSIRIYFCDVPVHGKLSQFYISWFLAALVETGNGDRGLMQAREKLFELAEHKETDVAKIKAAYESLGVEAPVNTDAIQNAYAAANSAADLEPIVSTPTVVVEGKSGRRKILKGKFTEQELADAIQSLK